MFSFGLVRGPCPNPEINYNEAGGDRHPCERFPATMGNLLVQILVNIVHVPTIKAQLLLRGVHPKLILILHHSNQATRTTQFMSISIYQARTNKNKKGVYIYS